MSNWGTVIDTNNTDKSGYYNLNLTWFGELNILAYFDNQSTPGFDYLPAVQKISVNAGEVNNCSFSLWEGASIILEGDPLLVETTEQIEWFSATVINPETGVPPSGIIGVFVYGSGSPQSGIFNKILNIESQEIIIPANTPVALDLTLNVSPKLIVTNETQTNETQPFFLNQGDIAKVDLQKASLERDLQVTQSLITQADEFLGEAKSSGLYVAVETNSLSQAAQLLSSARDLLVKGDQSECFADLREAYITASYTEESVGGMLTEASQSTFAILPFMAFTCVAVAFLLSDEPRRKWGSAILLYGILISFFWITYPGFKLVDPINILVVASLSLAATIFIIVVLPRQYSEMADETGIVLRSAIVSAFSLAKRSLRRRRLRSVLIFVSIIIMVWAFTILTSVSLEYGLATETYPPRATPGEGMLIKNSPVGSAGYPQPVSESTLEWLMANPEVRYVAPKAESYPQDRSVQLTINENETGLPIYGWLGIVPSNESAVTGFDKLVSAGRFLSDNDANATLISESATETLNATGQLKLNMPLYLEFFNMTPSGESTVVRSFLLVGLMKDNLLKSFNDFDGESIMPQYPVEGQLQLTSCPSDSILVLPFETALTLPSTFLSRIDVTVSDEGNLISLARQVALDKGYDAWVSLPGSITHLFVGSYAVYQVSGIIFPLGLVIIDIGVMMAGTMYERRRESIILSVTGLNPSHITSLYTAEAIIIGFIGGTIGYLSGVMSYRVMALLHIAIMVEQKISITWSIAAIGLSVLASVVASVIPATQALKVALPSLKLKWKFEEKTVEKPSAADMPWTIRMPAKIPINERKSFFSFLISSMKKYSGGSYESVRAISLKEEGREEIRLSFQYAYGEGTFPVTYNELVAKLDKKSNSYDLELRCKSPARSSFVAKEKVYTAASFVRRLVLEWTGIALKKK
jgi:ABC-type antimicrobial peptide transport system permease subunit